MPIIAWKVLAGVALIGAILFGINWFLDYKQQIGYDRRVAEDNVALIAAKDAAKLQEQVWRDKKQEAENDGLKRAEDTQRRLDVVTTERDGLRNDFASYRRRLSHAPIETCREAADSGLQLLDACIGRYIEVAQAALGHLNDATTCQAEWPQ